MNNIVKFLESLIEGVVKLFRALTSPVWSSDQAAIIVAPKSMDSGTGVTSSTAPPTQPQTVLPAPQAAPPSSARAKDDDKPAEAKSTRRRAGLVWIVIFLVLASVATVAIFGPRFTSGEPDDGMPVAPGEYAPPPIESTPILPVESSPTADPCVGITPSGKFVGDITIPDGAVVEPGTLLTKTWRFMNPGPCPWSEGFIARFVSGEGMGAIDVVLSRVESGQTIDVSVELTAPEVPGRYRGVWSIFDNQGNKVIVTKKGGDFWVDIQVFLAYITSTPAP